MKKYPVGAATYSKAPERYAEGAPRTINWARGAWVAESNVIRSAGPFTEKPPGALVDLTSGMGAVILGHQHPDVQRRMAKQMNEGVAYPLPSMLEEQVAERLLDMLTWERAESVRFGKNGADVTTSAVRLARAVTGRQTVLYMDYHGHHDWCMTEPPMNAGVFVPYHTSSRMPATAGIDEVYRRMQEAYPAAIVLEGSSSVAPGHPRWEDDFWRELRDACDAQGTLLILDEMVTGFRMAPGGAAEAEQIEPDIACYGKAMANGMPLSAIVGPWEYMKRYEEDVFFSLTHGGEALSLAAADETMRIVKEEDVPAQVAVLGNEIVDLLDDRVRYGYPQRLVFDFSKEELGTLLDRGVLCAGYANLTLAHVTDGAARTRLMAALVEAL